MRYVVCCDFCGGPWLQLAKVLFLPQNPNKLSTACRSAQVLLQHAIDYDWVNRNHASE